MPNSPEAFKNKLDEVSKAWAEEAPEASFGGMNLQKFQEAIKPSYDARDKVSKGERLAQEGANERADADRVSNEKLLLAVNGVKGDPNYGENSDLYEAMGYVRKTERRSGLTRKKKTAVATA
jgi:hypothetical protein